jgi:hypothetical protein
MPAQDLSSAIELQPVPDYWPPLPSNPATETLPGQSPGPLSAIRPRTELPAAVPGQPWPRQFAVLLAEGLAGVRPVRQVLPWMSDQSSAQLHRLLPLFADGHRPRLQRVITAQPARDVIEMTMIVAFGPRTRALAVRLEQVAQPQRPQWRCTAIEAA